MATIAAAAPSRANPQAKTVVRANERDITGSGKIVWGIGGLAGSVVDRTSFVNQGRSAMYIPAHFAPPDHESLYAAIERYSFATLVSPSAGGLVASHLPLLVARRLHAGAAMEWRATELWSATWPARTCSGARRRGRKCWRFSRARMPISRRSGTKPEKVVPTWNYVAVHAYGRLELIEDPAAAEAVLRRTVAVYEASQPRPWTTRRAG